MSEISEVVEIGARNYESDKGASFTGFSAMIPMSPSRQMNASIMLHLDG